MKLFKYLVLQLARVSGVEKHIREKQRIELADHMQTGCRYFRNSFHGRSPRVANAFFLYSQDLKAGDEKPDLKTMLFAVTAAGSRLLFEEAKHNG